MPLGFNKLIKILTNNKLINNELRSENRYYAVSLDGQSVRTDRLSESEDSSRT